MQTKSQKRGLRRLFTSVRNATRYSERVVAVGHRQLDGDAVDAPGALQSEQQKLFIGNEIVTSKYTIFTFLPLNLFEQFRRIANFYFLIVAVLQLSIDSPVSPFTSIAPLLFVVLVTMIKQGYEDFLRHRADAVVNERLVAKVVDGNTVHINAEKIEVGDILCIRDGEDFPCDLVVLSSSFPNGKANILTANLDGETNLKVHSAPAVTRKLQTLRELTDLRAAIECESPNADLNGFVGRLRVSVDDDGAIERCALGPENIVLRGAQLKNTEEMYGCAVYTGYDTKMSKNSRMTRNKFSTVEKSMNKYLIFYLILLVAEITLASVLKYTVSVDRPAVAEDDVPWYLGGGNAGRAKDVLQDVLSFLVLFNYIIPISLYVTIELQKFFGSLFLVWDVELYDEETGQPAKCNTSDLNEELGQVEYLFSDKTGTLTENIMEFRECSIGGTKYHDMSGNLKLVNQEEDLVEMDNESVKDFVRVLALCHTAEASVRSSGENGNVPDVSYSASSPDEKAIVEACQRFGVVFSGLEEDADGRATMHLRMAKTGKIEHFRRLQVLDFDSDRKCMSVVVESSGATGHVTRRLLCKGAESSVLPRCVDGPAEITNKHIDEYAAVGLRTLAVAVKNIDDRDYEQFLQKFTEASQALQDREKKVRGVYSELEQGLTLLGAIGVEDKLQEGVRETLVRLGQAGIKVWILTGDKKETAINISHSCGHFQSGMRLVDVTSSAASLGHSVLATLEDRLRTTSADAAARSCLVVDGATLAAIFAFADNVAIFQQLADRCQAVICCRMSPLQKAEIVKMIKKSPRRPITAAVGDGANDVSMIQEAHVGLGITGREGRAAVRAADFAFGKFKHLQRVLLVHGHWYYYRVAVLVQYFFYKNVAAFSAQLYYAFFNSYSTETLYDSVNLTLFNITFTSLPVFVFGLFEQNLSADLLLKRPELYKKIARNALLSFKEFAIWFVEGVWHSLVTFFFFYAFWRCYLNQTSSDFLERISFGLAVYQSVVVVVNLRLLLQSRFWNGFLLFSVAASMLFFLFFTMTVHALRADPSFASFFLEGPVVETELATIPLSPATYRVIFHVLSSGGVWLLTLLVVATCLSLDMAVAAVRKSWKGISAAMPSKRWKDIITGTRRYDLSQSAFNNSAFIKSTETLAA